MLPRHTLNYYYVTEFAQVASLHSPHFCNTALLKIYGSSVGFNVTHGANDSSGLKQTVLLVLTVVVGKFYLKNFYRENVLGFFYYLAKVQKSFQKFNKREGYCYIQGLFQR